MHLTDSQIAALVHDDGASLGTARAVVVAHAATCVDCAARVAAMRAEDREVGALLRALDGPVPRVTAATIVAEARRRRARRRRPIIAGLAFCGTAAAAAALPGSPLRRTLERVVAEARTRARAPAIVPRATSATSATSATPLTATGIALTPGTSLTVRFRGWQSRGALRIVLVDSAQASLVSSGSSAAFALQRDGIVVENRGAAESFTLAVPRRVPHVAVTIDTMVVFRLTNGDVRTAVHRAADGTYLLDLAAPR